MSTDSHESSNLFILHFELKKISNSVSPLAFSKEILPHFHLQLYEYFTLNFSFVSQDQIAAPSPKSLSELGEVRNVTSSLERTVNSKESLLPSVAVAGGRVREIECKKICWFGYFHQGVNSPLSFNSGQRTSLRLVFAKSL
jgi:hypothetical protein